MLKFLLLLLICFSLYGNDYNNLTLKEFTSIVSKQTNKNIYIDEDLNSSISFFIPNKVTEKDLFRVYQASIEKNDFQLSKFGDVYYLTHKSVLRPHIRTYTLKYNSREDIAHFFQLLDLQYTYLEDVNTIIFKTDVNTYNFILQRLKYIDCPKKQVYLKIMIFEFNDNKIKDIGLQFGSIYKDISSSTQYALNSVIASINTVSKPIGSFDFYSAIKLLQENDLLTVKQNPFILAKHNKKFSFEAVTNIPYLVSTTTTEATNTSQQNSFQYKDVGLKISGKSFIYDDYVSLDLNLIIEDILNSGDTPTSFKRTLSSNANVNYNDVLILSGIKKTKLIENDYSVPYLSNIPFIGKIFEYKSTSNQDTKITIAIQVLRYADEGFLPPSSF